MRFCTSCGHQLGVGRFCTNCGLRVDSPAADHEEWRTDTAERLAVPPDPAPARFPLFADQVEEPGAAVAADVTDVTAEAETDAVSAPETESAPVEQGEPVSLLPMTETTSKGAMWPSTPRGRRAAYVVIGVVVVWATVAVLGAALLLAGRDSGDSGSAKDPDSPTTPTKDPSTDPPSSAGTKTPPRPVDVAQLASARAPSVAPPGQDVDGKPVSYGARHMLDHDHTTCWRMEGDGTNATVTFTLRQSTLINRVGLVNGYAKVATDAYGNTYDWYAGNRRILTVQWEFDDGTKVKQDLRENRRMQTIKVPPVESLTVRLKLLSVSEPGSGNSYSDDTAISEISLIGRPD